MLAVWTFIKGAFSFIVKNWGWIATVAMLLFIFLSFQQCKAKRIAQAETTEAKRIADNNLKALKDSTIVLKMTREQLAYVDANLTKVTKQYDSLKQHPQTIIITKPVYVPKEVTTDNKLIRDPNDLTKYGLRFYSFDSVRTIGAVSWFNAVETPTKLEITPGKTVIDNFSLNFGLAIAKWDDKKNKMTRLAVTPYFVDSCGNYTNPISKNLLNMQIRGADLLDVPYVDNPKSDPSPPKHKYSLRSGFSLSVNLVSYGYTPFTTTPAFNWMCPSVGVGYSFVLVRNK